MPGSQYSQEIFRYQYRKYGEVNWKVTGARGIYALREFLETLPGKWSNYQVRLEDMPELKVSLIQVHNYQATC